MGLIGIPSEVMKAFRLSAQAKSIYGILLSDCHNRKSNISIDNLIFLTQLSERSIRTYISELLEFGLISKDSQRKQKKTVYLISDWHKITFFCFSEQLHRLCKQYEKFYTSKTCFQVADQIAKLIGFDVEFTKENQEDLQREFLNALKGKEVKTMFYPKNAKVPEIPEMGTLFDVEEEKPKKKRKVVTFKEKVVGEWNAKDFVEFFYECYFNRYQQQMATNYKEHVSVMKRFIEKFDSPFKIKEHIEAFFKLDYETHRLNYMVSSGIFDLTNDFIHKGKLPFFLEKDKPKTVRKIEKIQDDLDMLQFLDESNKHALKLLGDEFFNEPESISK